MPLVIGLDLGTHCLRAGVYDGDSGKLLAMERADLKTHYPKSGWAEQNLQSWQEALDGVICRLTNNPSYKAISAICVATTASSVVVCKKDGTPLFPVIMWMDCRAAEQAAKTKKTNHPVLSYSGLSAASEWLIPKAMWLKEHHAEIYKEADVICEAVDYINFLLCRSWVASQMNATCKWHYDPLEKRFYADLYESFGISDLLDRLPNQVFKVGDPIATMPQELANHYGFSMCPVIVQGGIDAHIGMLGAGTASPYKMLMIGGTSSVNLIQTPHMCEIPGIWGPYPHALTDGLWLMEGGQVSSGSVLEWLTDKIFMLDQAGQQELWQAAAKRPACSEKLMALDYFQGNRTPYRDPLMRGAITGLTLNHDRVSLYRAIIDALALNSLLYVETMKKAGIETNHWVIAGGIRHNPIWLKATINAIGKPINVCYDENLTVRGCAIAAIFALNSNTDLVALSESLSAKTVTEEPDNKEHETYKHMLSLYCELTENLAQMNHKLIQDTL